MNDQEQIAPDAPVEPITEASSPPETKHEDDSVDRQIARKRRRSLLAGGLATLAGAGAWEWLRSRRSADGIPWPLRMAHETNEELSRDYFRPARLARTFSSSDVEEPRQNGDIGLDDDVDPSWKLTVDGAAATGQPLSLAFDEINTL